MVEFLHYALHSTVLGLRKRLGHEDEPCLRCSLYRKSREKASPVPAAILFDKEAVENLKANTPSFAEIAGMRQYRIGHPSSGKFGSVDMFRYAELPSSPLQLPEGATLEDKKAFLEAVARSAKAMSNSKVAQYMGNYTSTKFAQELALETQKQLAKAERDAVRADIEIEPR